MSEPAGRTGRRGSAPAGVLLPHTLSASCPEPLSRGEGRRSRHRSCRHRDVVLAMIARRAATSADDLARRERAAESAEAPTDRSVRAPLCPGQCRALTRAEQRLYAAQAVTRSGRYQAWASSPPAIRAARVAQSIEQAGSATGFGIGPLCLVAYLPAKANAVRQRERWLPWPARGDQEMPVPLNGGGFGSSSYR